MRGRKRKDGVVREPSGKISRNQTATAERKETIMRTVMETRARRAGIDIRNIDKSLGSGWTAEILRQIEPSLLQPWMESDVTAGLGREKDAVELWETVIDIRRVRTGFLRAVGFPPDHPRIVSLGVPDDHDTDDQEKPKSDFRSDSEKAESGKRAWAEMVEAMRKSQTEKFLMATIINCASIPGDLPGSLRRLKKALAI